MTTLRQLGYGLALLAAIGLWGWTQYLQQQASSAQAETAAQKLSQAEQRIERQATTITTMADQLDKERTAQAALREQQAQLRQGITEREHHIERLKRENAELKNWAEQPLPAAVVRLRQRPAITGAAAYRDWLSRSGAVPATGDQPGQ